MKISVIIPTNRYGGLDITFAGLGRSTEWSSDWEVIMIDDFVEDRKDKCLYFAKKYDIKNVIYLRPKKGYWRSNTPIANSRNTGLIYAKGELIVFIDDYTWIPSKFLEQHWKVYNEGYCMVGNAKVVVYTEEKDRDDKLLNNINKLPSPIVNKNTKLDMFDGCSQFMKNIALFNIADTRGNKDIKDCGGGWFYTCNTSAPLEKIIQVNGFDEEYDLTRQVDIGLGLMLERIGCKFYYKTCPECTAYHMDHIPVEKIMKDKGMKTKRYKDITYDELRKRRTIESNPDEKQLVLKERYSTTHDGAWGLNEDRIRKRTIYANIINGKKIFDLKEERRKIGNWV